ncbi:MAG: transglutaminase-like domain-containing protein [bacterium]
MTETDETDLLQSTAFIESDAPEVIRFAREAVSDAKNDLEKGVMLYYAVRDEIRYDPYRITLTEDCYRATTVLRERAAYCIPKAVLLTAAARAVGIPSALGFADVKNHLTSEKLLEAMGTDLFIYHGYSLLKLEGNWVKATPAFNLSLCEKFGVKPLEFDGRSDALFHPYDSQNRRHMEYINERGIFADMPFEEIASQFRSLYGKFFQQDRSDSSNFEEEKPLQI